MPCANVPSGSKPTTELRPLQLWPRLLANIAEPIEYKDEKDNRLDSAPSTSDRGSRNASGSNWRFTWPSPPRLPSSVGVASDSSIAEPLLALPKYSKRLLSDALDVRREGICRIALEPSGCSGGSDTLVRSTLPPPVSGSLERAFLLAAVALLAVESCCHECVLSALAVRDNVGSMTRLNPAPGGVYAVQMLSFFQEAAVLVSTS